MRKRRSLIETSAADTISEWTTLSVITKMTTMMRTGTVIMLLRVRVRDNERRLPLKSDLLLSGIGPLFFFYILFILLPMKKLCFMGLGDQGG
jgi:hypothetical protein